MNEVLSQMVVWFYGLFLVGIKCYLTVLLTCTYNDVEGHPFLCFLVISVSLVKCTFKSFSQCLINCWVFLLLSYKCSLDILETSPLSELQFSSNFSWSLNTSFRSVLAHWARESGRSRVVFSSPSLFFLKWQNKFCRFSGFSLK